MQRFVTYLLADGFLFLFLGETDVHLIGWDFFVFDRFLGFIDQDLNGFNALPVGVVWADVEGGLARRFFLLFFNIDVQLLIHHLESV